MKARILHVTILSTFFIAALGCKKKTDLLTRDGADTEEAWDTNSDPLTMGASFVKSFEQLPQEGNIGFTPWTDTYWPSRRASIADRWNDQSNPSPYTYKLYSKEELTKLSQDELKKLSPAEKYDIYMGRYDYPSVEWSRKWNKPSNPGWAGICHGWAPASALYQEPRPVNVTNQDGISVPFGSGDVKGLLSYYQGNSFLYQLTNVQSPYLALTGNETQEELDSKRTSAGDAIDGQKTPAIIVGNTCIADGRKRVLSGEINFKPLELLRRRFDSGCRKDDLNAGAFHVILTNQIGIQKRALIADIDRTGQVWNHPIYTYQSRVLNTKRPSFRASREAVKELVVQTTIGFAGEVPQSQWDALGGSDIEKKSLRSLTFKYRVEINANGEIVGGRWVSRYVPDFLWTQDKTPFQGYFEGIDKIYQASIAPR